VRWRATEGGHLRVVARFPGVRRPRDEIPPWSRFAFERRLSARPVRVVLKRCRRGSMRGFSETKDVLAHGLVGKPTLTREERERGPLCADRGDRSEDRLRRYHTRSGCVRHAEFSQSSFQPYSGGTGGEGSAEARHASAAS
jgi:hypothetical protein